MFVVRESTLVIAGAGGVFVIKLYNNFIEFWTLYSNNFQGNSTKS